MWNGIVVEASQNVDDRIGLLDIGEELITASFHQAAAFGKAGNIDDLYRRGNNFNTLDEFIDLIKPLIGNVDCADVGLGRSARLGMGIGKTIEYGGLTYERKSDNTAF
jgi:hypothetical protein